MKPKLSKWLIAILCLVISINVDSDEVCIHSQNFFSIELQNYLDHHWMVNRQLFDSLECVKIQPRLYLYSKIDRKLIEQYGKSSLILEQQIDFNEKLQRTFNVTNLPKIMYELKLQNILLKIAHAFNQSLQFRRQVDLPHAMESVDLSFALISSYKELYDAQSLKYFKSPASLLAIANYHKGKLHRLLTNLTACEECYLEALKTYPEDPVIHSSLGFLYNDLIQHKEALEHHQLANQIKPNFPDFMHGLAYGLYSIEQQAFEKDCNFNRKNVEMACNIFQNALQLFEEYETQNSRIYLDLGKAHILLENYDQALQNFNLGLKIDPHHPLLLKEKESLIHQMDAKTNSSPKALNEPRLLHQEDIYFCQTEPIMRKAFMKFLIECANYIEQCKGNKKTKIFICYAWHSPEYTSSKAEHQLWIEQFAKDLEMAGFEVLFDRWTTRKGHEKMEFVEKIMTDASDYILVIGSKLFLDKYNDLSWNNNEREKVLRIETRLLNHLIGFNQTQSNKVVPVLIEGTAENALPPLLRIKNLVDFTLNDYYLEMSELIRDLHEIDQRDLYFKKLIINLKNVESA